MSDLTQPGTLMEQGVDMMLYGMGTVFAFLLVLVLAIAVMSRVLAKYAPEPGDTVAMSEGGAASDVDALTVKIITAAIDQHRKRQHRKR